MTALHDTLRRYVDDGSLPGAVGLLARGDEVEAVAVGYTDTGRSVPLARDSLFRLASVTKPVTAAALLMLVDEGRVGPDDPVARWLPELAEPMVVRTPGSPVDDLVPAARPITVEDVLSSRCGWGFPPDFSLPAVAPLFELQRGGFAPHAVPAMDELLAELAGVPLLHQPGDAWLYNTSSDLQGALIARATGRTLPDFLAERIFEPLGMTDTGFSVPERGLHRLPTAYQPDADGTLKVAETFNDGWDRLPAFPSGAGGLVSTADDYLAFARMLLAGGEAGGGRRLLSPESVTRMTSDQLTPAQRKSSSLFLEGQGWGYGGSVDIERTEPWHVPGRYGWVGGTGTAAHLVPATGKVTVLLTQVAMTGPTAPAVVRDFWRVTA
ncbi:serine hydrolase domain-containing protein [Streptomyces sp. NPDC046860]|uniref:serine hydrolase domain-containing protein n=1 Tax=Streptomyces sp. NPDC046860 TaxID=3154495 RepID=UPI0033F7D706